MATIPETVSWIDLQTGLPSASAVDTGVPLRSKRAETERPWHTLSTCDDIVAASLAARLNDPEADEPEADQPQEGRLQKAARFLSGMRKLVLREPARALDG